jgi:hypothetical protein
MCQDLRDGVSSSDEHDEVCMYVCRDVTGFEIRYNGAIDAAMRGFPECRVFQKGNLGRGFRGSGLIGGSL